MESQPVRIGCPTHILMTEEDFKKILIENGATPERAQEIIDAMPEPEEDDLE